MTLNTSYCVWGDGFEETVYPWPSGTSTTSAPQTPTSTRRVDTVEPPVLVIQQ
jgi:hypothetical protein